ncbi:MAG: hypothetical protein R2824_24025 [Saprospiraceae bacterium]|nr:hypothetical protein [Lewinella sp.]
MYNVSKPTLYADMKTGKLSYAVDDRKKRKINVAELDRLYEKRETEEGSFTSESVQPATFRTESNVALKKEIETIRESLATSQNREIQLLNNQIEQLQNQVENLTGSLNKALDVTALLEDKREGQGTKEAQTDAKLELLEKQISKLEVQNQRLLKREEEREKRVQMLKKEAKGKNKSFLKKLFRF